MKVIKGNFSGRTVSTKTGNICICSFIRYHDIYILAEDIISCREIIGNIKEFALAKSFYRYLLMLLGQSHSGMAGVLSVKSDLDDCTNNIHIAELKLKTGEVLFIKCENNDELLELLYASQQAMTYQTSQAMANKIPFIRINITKNLGCLLFIAILFILLRLL